jgi:uncharacterized protein (DUF924 family)
MTMPMAEAKDLPASEMPPSDAASATVTSVRAETPDAILSFWVDDVGAAGWYKQDAELDAAILARFGPTWEMAMDGRFAMWMTYPSGALAYLVLTDQFPRNMFRGTARAFASDAVALAVAKRALRQGYDLKIDPPARQFFYLPLMHSENLADQERCVRLMHERLPGEDNLLHARAHREVIRQFGRFPYRNAALSRKATASEEAYVAGGGYSGTLAALRA